MSNLENSEDKSALLCLPDDLLITILGYLDRKTQLMLTNMHLRFLTIMPNIWRSRYRSLQLTAFDGANMPTKDFHYFIGSLQSTLNALWMEVETKQLFDILVKFVFPNLHTFKFITNLENFCDVDIQRMVEAFPNLRTFSPQGFFTGEYIDDFPHLENLTLTHCKSFEINYLIRILEIRSLKTLKLAAFGLDEILDTDLPLDKIRSLEVLKCNPSEMDQWFLRNLKQLTQLKQLSLEEFNCSFLQSLVLSGVRRPFKSLVVNRETNFTNIVIINQELEVEVLKVRKVTIYQKPPSFQCFKNVKEIYLIDCVFFARIHFNILMNLKSTEIVTLDECEFNFNEYTFVAKDIGMGRSKSLNLYLDPNMISYSTHPDAQSAFLSLPDDALILILKKLDLSTQLKMLRVHSRFWTMIPQVWRSQYRFTSLSPIEVILDVRDLRFFLGSNRETFEVLRLKMLERVNFLILTDFIFPNVHDFRFSTYSFALQDSNIPSIIRAFPNLRTFSPYGKFTGQYMKDFPHLENLTLTYCRDFKVSNLISILKTRKLKGLKLDLFDDKDLKNTKLPLEGIRHLESLHCDTKEMAKWFLKHIENLTKLKKLIFCGHINWKVVKRVLNSSHRKSIKCVQLNATNADIYYLFHDPTVIFNISQVYIKKIAITKPENIDILLKGLKTLEILGLEGCTFSFRKYTFVVSEIVKNRSSALNVHLHQNAYVDKNVPIHWKVEGQDSLFKLHKGALNIAYESEPVAIYFD